jgi:uncharacterized protein with HEPN domain
MLDKDYYILLSMIETFEKNIRFSSPYKTAEAFYENDRDFDAIMMNFIVIGETVDKLSDTLKSKNSGINWEKIYGLRNILAHHYFGINVDLIWQIIQNDIPVLKQELVKLINKINKE